uniref:Mannose receptor, C type 1b n=1 Tax=Oryzias latipes TaxID=8090 RepID=A0A3P9H7Q4_ORYLA
MTIGLFLILFFLRGGYSPEAGLCTAPWISYNGRCYQLYRSQKTWSDAQIACRKEEGDLVSIHNVEEQSFIFSELVPTDELWIGLNDRTTEGLFDWSDQSAVRFTSWEFGKPGVEENQEDCVLIRGQGSWNDNQSLNTMIICVKHFLCPQHWP